MAIMTDLWKTQKLCYITLHITLNNAMDDPIHCVLGVSHFAVFLIMTPSLVEKVGVRFLITDWMWG